MPVKCLQQEKKCQLTLSKALTVTVLHENFVNGFKNLFFVLFSVVKKAVKMQFTFSDIQHKNGISVSPAVERKYRYYKYRSRIHSNPIKSQYEGY